MFAESLALFRQFGSWRGIAECAEAFAAAALAGGQPEHAARLWGAADALRGATGAARWAADQFEHERDMAALYNQIDAATLARAWAIGRALTPEQAIAELKIP